MKKRSKVIQGGLVLVLVCLLTSVAFANDYCIRLSGGEPINISINFATGDVIGNTPSQGYTWVGIYSHPYLYMSLGYYDASTRPILHQWNAVTMKGNGRAYVQGNPIEKWNYSISMCSTVIQDIEGDSFDSILGE